MQASQTFDFRDNSGSAQQHLGPISERGMLLTLTTGFLVLIGMIGVLGCALSAPPSIGGVLLFGFFGVCAVTQFVSFAMEVRLAPDAMRIRRLRHFTDYPWSRVTRARITSLRTTGITWIALHFSVGMPRYFALWVPWYAPERWKTLNRLIDAMQARVPVQHSF
jgi:hypothetical protein